MGVYMVSAIPEMLAAADGRTDALLRKAGADILGISQENHRYQIRTGNLVGSGYIETGDLEVTIGYGAEYAVYVHEGQRKWAPDPFLRSAFDRVAPELVKALGAEVLRP